MMAGIGSYPGTVVPPTIVNTIQDQFAMCGKPWELKIDIGGDVPVEVKIEKDNIQFPENDHMKITSCNNVVTVRINDVKEEDAGEYKLEVSNDGGSATCTFNMVVRKYNFRYQYLLVEIGTKVMRTLFDSIVGHDLNNYLAQAANKSKSLALTSLIAPDKGRPILTPAQAKLLPPLDANPQSSNFDITLLSCLLRTVCGLKSSSDSVWKTPAATDLSMEADITRLRQCRNHLAHSGTVRFPANEFTNKWMELNDILLRLNQLCGKDCIIDLQTLIDEAEEMDTDEGISDKLIRAIKQWYDNEQSLKDDIARVDTIATSSMNIATTSMNISTTSMNIATTVKNEQQGIMERLDDVEQANKHHHVVDESDVKKNLVDLYKRRFKTLPVSPLFKNKDENLFDIYKPPAMNSVKCTGEESKECKDKKDVKFSGEELSNVNRNDDESEDKKEITGYGDIFRKKGAAFEEIYIIGDAGVGKTSFCTCMSLLWCYAINREQLEEKYKNFQKDTDYISKFEFVFFVNLRDTCHTHVIDMIIEQLFEDNKERYGSAIDNILREKPTLILMDGLDEWMPSQVAGKPTFELPVRRHSKNIVHITTSRPYRIESVRLASKDVDHLVEITGISDESSKHYVEDVIKYINKENHVNKNLSDFTSDMTKCKLDDLMCIPIIASHLVVLWFEMTMTEMPRALIYANILEMLFKRAEQKGLNIPPSTESKFQHLPDSLSGLKHLNKHASLLYNLCHLSFRSLFKQDENATTLVFTEDQLLDEPYYFTNAEIDFLCIIGILSKNEVFGCNSVEKLKISFIHKSYIDFFSALFISSSDIGQLLDERWKSLDYVLKHENLIVLLVGFFTEGGKVLFDNLYQMMSDDLSLCRRNAIFHHKPTSYLRQLKSLQTLVIKCFKELRISNDPSISIKLEDFIFYDYPDVDILKRLLELNTACVKSVHHIYGEYYDAFDEIRHLQMLHVRWPGQYGKLTECMLDNHSTLHTVCIESNFSELFVPKLPVRSEHRVKTFFLSLFNIPPVRSLHHLTSLSLSFVKMEHKDLNNLMKYLSHNVRMQNISLCGVFCNKHVMSGDCTSISLNLPHHTHLESLCLKDVDIVCKNVNTSRLKSITLGEPFSRRIIDGYISIFKSMKCSQLEHLDVGLVDYYMALGDKTIRTLTTAVNTLPCIQSLHLTGMIFPDDVMLQLHDEVKQVIIELYQVTMSLQCFRCFIESCVNKQSVIKVELAVCEISSVDGETHRKLSCKDSVHYVSEYLTSIQTVNITHKSDVSIDFETTGCQ